jgi:hypothetical protein
MKAIKLILSTVLFVIGLGCQILVFAVLQETNHSNFVIMIAIYISAINMVSGSIIFASIRPVRGD